MPILRELVAELEGSGSIERCAAEHPDDTGRLLYRLRIAAGKVEIDFGGDLYATGAGRCIAEAQARIAAARELPPEVSTATLFHRVELPLEEPVPQRLQSSSRQPWAWLSMSATSSKRSRTSLGPETSGATESSPTSARSPSIRR